MRPHQTAAEVSATRSLLLRHLCCAIRNTATRYHPRVLCIKSSAPRQLLGQLAPRCAPNWPNWDGHPIAHAPTHTPRTHTRTHNTAHTHTYADAHLSSTHATHRESGTPPEQEATIANEKKAVQLHTLSRKLSSELEEALGAMARQHCTHCLSLPCSSAQNSKQKVSTPRWHASPSHPLCEFPAASLRSRWSVPYPPPRSPCATSLIGSRCSVATSHDNTAGRRTSRAQPAALHTRVVAAYEAV